jgi:hypothetical protein
MNEVSHHLGNDSSSFHPVHSLIRAVGPPDLHHSKGRGLRGSQKLRELLALASRHQAQRGCTPLPRAQWRAGDGDTPELGDERSTSRWVLVHHQGARAPLTRHQGSFGAFGLARDQSATEFGLTLNEPCPSRNGQAQSPYSFIYPHRKGILVNHSLESYKASQHTHT